VIHIGFASKWYLTLQSHDNENQSMAKSAQHYKPFWINQHNSKYDASHDTNWQPKTG